MSNLVIEPILEDELYTTPPLMKVVVAKLIGSKRDIPRVFRLTQSEVSIGELKHLRRIRDLPDGRIECILCKVAPDDDHDEAAKLARVSKQYVDERIFEDFRIVEVPSSAPRTEHQLRACTKLWPCKYAKSSYLISCIQGSAFDGREKLVLDIVVGSLMDFVKSSGFSGGAIVFRFAQIYGSGLSSPDVVRENPVKHSAMLAIDSVAQNAGGGHWCKSTATNQINSDTSAGATSGDKNLCRKSNYLINHVQERLDCQETLSDYKIEPNFLPYLCTNYDIFITEEPCMMCTMGLVQSRIRRLFYLDRDDASRLFGERLCYPDRAIEQFLVHRDRSLNHRFEAWRIKLKKSGDDKASS